MKNFIASLCLLSVVAYWNGASTYAQSKGGSHQDPSVSQGHSQGADHSHQQTNHVSSDHGKPGTWETTLSDRFNSDIQFHNRMQSLLPQGMDLKTAESGFKNKGQFIAALHVSKNLDIPFDQLKAKMTGVSVNVSVNAAGQTTTSTPMSLGKAIHELRPDLTESQANQQAQQAEKQTKQTESTSTTS